MAATILVVDDEEPIRSLLTMVFEDAGYHVLQASNGQEALDLLGQEHADLVLSDLMMPLVDGLELCRRLRATPATTALPVILMSASSRWQSNRSGADAMVSKPFMLEDVENLVHRLLSSL